MTVKSSGTHRAWVQLALAFALIPATCATHAAEGTVYIRDTLYVPLRGGQSTEHRILHRGLRSGTALTVLEENPDTEYSLVRTGSGLEGWLPTQYLTTEPIAEEQLEAAQRRAATTAQSSAEANARAQNLEGQIRGLREQLTAAEETTARLETELADLTRLAANVIEIDEQNRAHEGRVGELQREIEHLNQVNVRLGDDTRQDWFLRGAGVVLAGLLVGFWLARRIYNRRNTGGWS